ncbi:hypothetical protein [Vibrio owensii]|uniref:hypothetical protein n=1 Tax=Vibrio harveyi group TaxID=717610 RepID=UPI003CC66484
MAKHKKYEMLLAKAENMDLIILLKYQGMPFWEKSPNSYPPNNDYTEAFLCLSHHQEACKMALNGSQIEIRENDGEWVAVKLEGKWMPEGWYMQEKFESRLVLD